MGHGLGNVNFSSSQGRNGEDLRQPLEVPFVDSVVHLTCKIMGILAAPPKLPPPSNKGLIRPS